MAACEACWAIYSGRRAHGEAVDYMAVLAEYEGKHSPEEMCGDLHITTLRDDGSERCACGKRVRESRNTERARTEER